MTKHPNVAVGQIWEDFAPIYDDPCQKRRLEVVDVFTKQDHVWSQMSQYARMRVIRDVYGVENPIRRPITVRIDRMRPKRGGYVLVEEAGNV